MSLPNMLVIFSTAENYLTFQTNSSIDNTGDVSFCAMVGMNADMSQWLLLTAGSRFKLTA